MPCKHYSRYKFRGFTCARGHTQIDFEVVQPSSRFSTSEGSMVGTWNYGANSRFRRLSLSNRTTIRIIACASPSGILSAHHVVASYRAYRSPVLQQAARCCYKTRLAMTSQGLNSLQDAIWKGSVPLDIRLSPQECRIFDKANPFLVSLSDSIYSLASIEIWFTRFSTPDCPICPSSYHGYTLSSPHP